MAEDSAPYRALAPIQPIAVFLDYFVYEVIVIPEGSNVEVKQITK